MLPAALALLIAVACGSRMAYARHVEARANDRRPRGPDGIVVGADPIDLPTNRAPAALLLHGAGDTPQVMAGLASHLHDRGFAVRVPLLAGHGRGLAEFSRVSAGQWHEQVRREYAALRSRHVSVAVVGLSMGGALAVTLAAEHPDMSALVLLSPYLAMTTFLGRLASTSRIWGPACPYFSSRGARSIRDPAAAARGLGYGVFTPAALRALNNVVTKGQKSLERVTSPTLMIQSREDNRISAATAERIFNRITAREKRLEWVDGAAHVITVDYGHEMVFASTGKWIQGHSTSLSS